MRDKRVKWLGVWFAGLALSIQLAFAVLGAPPAIAGAASADALGGHALCLAGKSGSQKQPTDNAPAAPSHDHGVFCCLWHSPPGVAPQATPATHPVAYAAVAHAEFGVAALLPGLPRGPANARAPPILT